MQPLVSVIIPVYNVEKYLEKCINSVVSQTYKNLEIILVDDGSTDNSGQMCDEFKKKDKRIKVIHKENGGLSDARNVALDVCKGDYITFVDSDDWIPRNAIDALCDAIISEKADISSGQLYETFKRQHSEKAGVSLITRYSTEDALRDLMYLHGLSNSASGKLYKRSLFSKIRYPIGMHYEDLGTTYKIFALAENIVSINKNVYFYYQNPKSIVHSGFSKKRLEGVDFALEEYHYIKNNFPSVVPAAKFRLVYECLSCLNDMPFLYRKKECVFSYVRRFRKRVLGDKNLYKKQKFIVLASYFGHIGVKIAFWIRKKRKMRRD